MKGPECPDCGCSDSQVVEEIVNMQSLVAQVRECSACGVKFNHATDEEVIWFHRLQCPAPGCGSKNVKVTHTRGRMRRHRCDDCDFRFRSVEA